MTGKSVVTPLSLKCLLQGDALIDREAEVVVGNPEVVAEVVMGK